MGGKGSGRRSKGKTPMQIVVPAVNAGLKYIGQKAYNYAVQANANRLRYQADRSKTRTDTEKKYVQPARKETYRTQGSMQGKIKSYPKSDKLFFQRHGVSARVETGGVVTDPDAVYIMHTTGPHRTIYQNVVRTIYKSLLKSAGYDIPNFEASVNAGAPLAIVINYRLNPATTTGWQSVNLLLAGTASTTYLDHCNDLLAQFTALFTAGRPVEIGDLILASVNAGVYTSQGRLDLRQYMLQFSVKSILKVQNTTLANVAAGDPNNDTSDDIERNPVQGFRYSAPNKWSNAIEYKDGRNAAFGSSMPITIGGITDGVATFLSTAVSDNTLKKPPLKGYFFSCKNQGKLVLEPGAIKYSNLQFTAQMMFNTFTTKFAEVISSPTANAKVEFGNVALLGLEKSLNSRQANGSSVRVSWQCDLTCKVAGFQKRKPASQEIITVL